jgi:hypothetical protein
VEEIMNESLLVVTTVLKIYFLGWDLNRETVTDDKRFLKIIYPQIRVKSSDYSMSCSSYDAVL